MEFTRCEAQKGKLPSNFYALHHGPGSRSLEPADSVYLLIMCVWNSAFGRKRPSSCVWALSHRLHSHCLQGPLALACRCVRACCIIAYIVLIIMWQCGAQNKISIFALSSVSPCRKPDKTEPSRADLKWNVLQAHTSCSVFGCQNRIRILQGKAKIFLWFPCPLPWPSTIYMAKIMFLPIPLPKNMGETSTWLALKAWPVKCCQNLLLPVNGKK